MDSYRHSQQIRQRILRHNRLMKLIHGYSRTTDENRKLEKIKSNTMMEINLRYLRSEHNRHYRFPLQEMTEATSSDEEDSMDDLSLVKKQLIIYDLHSQNPIQPTRSPSKKTISLESSRRVISLEIDRDNWQRERLLRLDFKPKNHLNPSISSKLLSKKNSFSEKMKNQRSRLRLPELKIQKYRQNLKTESRAPEEEYEIQSVVSKKLITQGSESRKKMQGVQKYLQKVQYRVVKPKLQNLKFK